MFLEKIQVNAIGQYLSVFAPDSRIYWLYLVTAIILAFIAYLQFNHDHDDEEESTKNKKGFLAFVFDKETYLHKSTWQDVKYFLVNSVVYYGIVTQYLIGTHGFALMFNNTMSNFFGQPDSPIITSEIGLIIYTVLSVIAIDLGVYLSHRAQHHIPILWEFHKVHHSAEKMTPITLFRMHPVDLFITAFVVSLLGGIAFAGLFSLTGEKPQALTLFGLNIISFGFYIAGYNLRHSHIWLNYPYWLSKILISPAQHQVHHSSDPKHFDRNFGLIFSFWDQIGKSHYIPRGFEKLTFGLSREEPNPFKSLSDLYFKPFYWAAGLLEGTLDNPRRKIIAGLALCVLALGYIQVSNSIKIQQAQSQLPSVHLAKLTWTEVDKALQEGYDSVIIPTAGIEQNGPHVVLGKHNIVVTQASHNIAHALGKTLVAPAIDHVPEGAIEPTPDGHMRFAGTISLSETLFEQLLIATARSMKAHGFKKIFFVGDSGGNQAAQEHVAKLLSQKWQGENMIVRHIGDYYAKNGQFEFLQNAGYTEAEIGYHAGIRDTSELLYIKPSAVHKHPILNPEGTSSGMSGDPNKANAKIGRKMLELKVQAAVAQIQEILKNSTETAPTDKFASATPADQKSN